MAAGIAYSIVMQFTEDEGGEPLKEGLRTAVLGLVVLLPGPVLADEPLRDTIQSLEDEWSAAYNANSKERLGAFYEEDAVLIPHGSPPVNGRAAIAETLSTLFPVLQNLKLVTDEVRPLGPNHAVEIGHSEYMAVAEDGSRTPTLGDYQVVWHKGDDGEWRYITDMLNAR